VAADPHDRRLEAARLELLGGLLAPALHELANPLLALVGTTELLLDEAVEPRVRERLELVHRTTDEIAGLVRSLQALVRERHEPERAVDLGAFARETASLAVRFSGVKDVDCEVSVDEDAGVVRVLPAVLRQAILALVLDALRSSPRGGRVEIVAGSSALVVSAGTGGGTVAAVAAGALGGRIERLDGQGASLRLAR
jgi:signal transduction histidine kinase